MPVILRPTVKRDLSLYSVESWRRGYPHRVIFHYDGALVHFYPPASEFAHFKETDMAKMMADDALFEQTNTRFIENVCLLRARLDGGELEDLESFSSLIGSVMSFYMMIVSDTFVSARPAAWPSRQLSEGILYEADMTVEKALGRRLMDSGLDPKMSHVLTVGESVALMGGSVPEPAIIQPRLSGYILDEEALHPSVHFCDYCREHGYQNPEDVSGHETTGLVRGTCVCPGHATGRVRIVRSRQDFDRIEEGDVIVAVMTNVHFLQIMSRVAAIVTDEGGVTCHAAIIAREFHKPCVIGTRTATREFKDGDLVEVNADRGEVWRCGTNS